MLNRNAKRWAALALVMILTLTGTAALGKTKAAGTLQITFPDHWKVDDDDRGASTKTYKHLFAAIDEKQGTCLEAYKHYDKMYSGFYLSDTTESEFAAYIEDTIKQFSPVYGETEHIDTIIVETANKKRPNKIALFHITNEEYGPCYHAEIVVSGWTYVLRMYNYKDIHKELTPKQLEVFREVIGTVTFVAQ